MKAEIEYKVMDGYDVRSYYSTDDEVYVAQIDRLPGCAADGESRDEALANLAVLKAEWIAQVSARGHLVPAPRHAPNRALA